MLFHPSASAEIFLTWAAEERANRIELTGTRGKLLLDGGRLTLYDVDGVKTIETWTFPTLTEGSHHPDWFGGANVLALARESDRRGGEPLSAERAVGPGARR